jgi:hypothetical protein
MRRLLIGLAVLIAFAIAAPARAQYYYPGYAQPYYQTNTYQSYWTYPMPLAVQYGNPGWGYQSYPMPLYNYGRATYTSTPYQGWFNTYYTPRVYGYRNAWRYGIGP